MTGDGGEPWEGGVCSSSRAIGDGKPDCLGVGVMNHMLGNVSNSARVGSAEPGVVPRGLRVGSSSAKRGVHQIDSWTAPTDALTQNEWSNGCFCLETKRGNERLKGLNLNTLLCSSVPLGDLFLELIFLPWSL